MSNPDSSSTTHVPDADMLYPGAPARGFMESVSTCFNKYITFSGRASRSEYWFFFLFCLIVETIASVVDTAVFGIDTDSSALASLAYLVLFLPGIAVQFRRLHDTNRSGWWVGIFWLGLPVWGFILLWLLESGPTGSEIDSFWTFENSIPDSAGWFIGGSIIGVLIYFLLILIFLCQRGDLVKNRFG